MFCSLWLYSKMIEARKWCKTGPGIVSIHRQIHLQKAVWVCMSRGQAVTKPVLNPFDTTTYTTDHLATAQWNIKQYLESSRCCCLSRAWIYFQGWKKLLVFSMTCTAVLAQNVQVAVHFRCQDLFSNPSLIRTCTLFKELTLTQTFTGFRHQVPNCLNLGDWVAKCR